MEFVFLEASSNFSIKGENKDISVSIKVPRLHMSNEKIISNLKDLLIDNIASLIMIKDFNSYEENKELIFNENLYTFQIK